MKQHHFVQPPGPLGPFASRYRVHLEAQGYRFGVVQHRMTQLSQLSRWLEANSLAAVELDEAQIVLFTSERRAGGAKTLTKPTSFQLPLSFLRVIGVVPERATGQGLFDELLARYARYLAQERGLCPKTVTAHLVAARRFCATFRDRGELEALGAAGVISYVMGAKNTFRPRAVEHVVTGLRSFLRYLYLSDTIEVDLVPAVPKLASRRPAPQPPALTEAELSRLLRSCDRRRGQGRRDYALLISVSRLGLRAGEIAALSLDDLDWRHGEVVVRGKGNHHERLPLPCEVGEALAAYLFRGRPSPTVPTRVVFLRSRAPWSPLNLSGVQAVVNRASTRAGLARFGPRRLRHTTASRMRQAGLSLAEVAQVMRHHDTRVTTVYVDVEDAALADLARPWPGSRS